MKLIYERLFEFLYEYTQEHIKDYENNACISMSYNEQTNRTLSLGIISELTSFTNTIIQILNQSVCMQRLEYEDNKELYHSILEQMRFYIQLELVCSKAASEICEDQRSATIHNQALEHSSLFTALLKTRLFETLDTNTYIAPATQIQAECQYKAYNLAFNGLECALKLRNDYKAELDGAIPNESEAKLRNYSEILHRIRDVTPIEYELAKYRFRQIEELHAFCKLLSGGSNKPNDNACQKILDWHEMPLKIESYRAALDNMLSIYKKINPDSTLLTKYQHKNQSEYQFYYYLKLFTPTVITNGMTAISGMANNLMFR